jgi:PPK2 family polyphosphate:nucleotide phosphotransferase
MDTDRFRVPDGQKKVRLQDYDPDDTAGLKSKDEAETLLAEGVDRLHDLQEKLYAQDRWAVLLIFQAMDAAGKDSTIEHVMSGVNPQGCQVFSFKAPSAEELDHDFLWRAHARLPERGRIGIFNRSYYEEVLVVRVHPPILVGQRLPERLVTKDVWQERFLSRNGTLIRKLFLHVSKKEQKRRFLDRLEEPEKHWKFALGDVKEREHWDDYMEAYEEVLEHTSTDHAPWYVIPADHKWFMRLAVAEVIVEALEGLKLAFPQVTEAKKQELAEARRLLEG